MTKLRKLIASFSVAWYSGCMQRIFKYDDIQNTSLTLDKELNTSTY